MGNLRDLSKKKQEILARHLYSNIVSNVIKVANIYGAPSESAPPTSPLLSLFLLHTFPLTVQSKQSNNLQDLLVNLHKETFRVI